MASNPLYCPFCGKEIVSPAPYPKSKVLVRKHIIDKHKELKGKVVLP